MLLITKYLLLTSIRGGGGGGGRLIWRLANYAFWQSYCICPPVGGFFSSKVPSILGGSQMPNKSWRCSSFSFFEQLAKAWDKKHSEEKFNFYIFGPEQSTSFSEPLPLKLCMYRQTQCTLLHERLCLYLGASFQGCVPLGWSRAGSVIQDHLDHGASKKLMNPLWTRILRFVWCTMIRVILEYRSWAGSSQRNTP